MSRTERKTVQIRETQRAVLARDNWSCVVCGAGATQCAHVLPQDTLHVAQYGAEVIHNSANLRAVCSLKCNAEVQINSRGHPVRAEKFARSVRKIIEEERCRKT